MGLFSEPPDLASLTHLTGDPGDDDLEVVIPESGRIYVEGSAAIAGGSRLEVSSDGQIVAAASTVPGGEWQLVHAGSWVVGEPGTRVTLRMAIHGAYQDDPAVPAKLSAALAPPLPPGLFG